MTKLRACIPLLIALAVALAAMATYGVASSQSANGKYDTDGDGLIEIEYLEQLDAIRYDTDGDGWADEVRDTDAYDAAFPVTGSQLVCNEGCTGYELTRSLDFDSAASYANGINEEWLTGNGWRSIYNFQATLVGHGNAISNLYSNSRYESGDRLRSIESGGLFYNILDNSAVIKGIKLLNANVTQDFTVGVLAGENLGTISHCYATGSIMSHSSDSSGDIGGLVGSNDHGTISHSYAEVAVTSDGKGEYVGGLVGRNGGTINNSYAAGSVTSNGDYVGGLVGSNTGTVTGSYATGSVTSTGNRVGGLVGYNSHYDEEITANIFDSYATGSVSGNGWVGGLVGQNGYSPGNGGVVTTSYAIGPVTGNRSVGGLIGYNYPGGSITDSYWNIDVTTNGIGDGNSNGATGQTAGQLQGPTANTGIYANWNVLHWDFGTSNQYPALKADFNGDGNATWREFGNQIRDPMLKPTSTPIPTPTLTRTPTVTPIPTPTYTPTPTATPTREPMPTPTLTPIPTATPIPTSAYTPTPMPAATPEPSPTPTLTPIPTATPEPAPTLTPTALPTDMPTPVAAATQVQPTETSPPPVQVVTQIVTVVVTATPAPTPEATPVPAPESGGGACGLPPGDAPVGASAGSLLLLLAPLGMIWGLKRRGRRKRG